jgi:hypothetical protein
MPYLDNIDISEARGNVFGGASHYSEASQKIETIKMMIEGY